MISADNKKILNIIAGDTHLIESIHSGGTHKDEFSKVSKETLMFLSLFPNHWSLEDRLKTTKDACLRFC